MNNNISFNVVSSSKGFIAGGKDDGGSSLLDNNDDDTTALKTEDAIDETVSITMTSVSAITMNIFFIFIL
jgi:hypothetical protein